MRKIISLLIFPWFLFACTNGDEPADAFGNFEAVEIMVSSEGNGKILHLELEEGDMLNAGIEVGLIDTIQLYLKKEQLKASIDAINAKTQNVQVQIDVLNKQRANLVREKKRIESLLADKAATQKQLDDMQGEIEVVDRRISATREQLKTGNSGLLSEIAPLSFQIEALEDQISKSIVRNPIKGTVLTKYAEAGEVTSFGKPLYKIADLDEITLRAYVSGEQLNQFKIGDQLTVRIDDAKTDYQMFSGKVKWVASEAEFTPKVIQTKDLRVNMVYAIKLSIRNDGTIKIGMPGEVLFDAIK